MNSSILSSWTLLVALESAPLTALVPGCAVRTHRLHSFVLVIDGPKNATFEGSYTVTATAGAKSLEKTERFRDPDLSRGPIRIKVKGRRLSYQLVNGAEPLTVKWVVDGKPRGTGILQPRSKYGSTWDPD